MNTTYVRMPTNKQLLTMGLPDLPEDAFGGTGPRLTPIARAIGGKQPALYGGGGGGLKAVVAVVAAVAVPVFAPQIAASIGLSSAVSGALAGTALAGASGAISSAIVGAGLGAITAAATGQNAGRGALFGAIGGGISGYQQINAATGALNTASGGAAATAAGGAPVNAPAPVYNVETGLFDVVNPATGDVLATSLTEQSAILTAQDAATTGIGAQLSGSTGNAVGYQSPVGLDTATAPVAGSTAPSVGSGTQVFDDGSTLTTSATGQTTATPAPASMQIPGAQPVAGAQTAGAQTASTITDRLATGVQQVGSEIAKKFTDPKQQADLLLRAAGQIAGTYLAPEGMSPEEQELLNQQRQELETLRATNQELFQEKLNAARQLVQDANYFDPEYFGLQRARQVQQAGAKVERERLAGIDPRRANLRAAEQRRTRLATGRDVGTAYDTGFTAAVDAQNRARTAGLNLYPTAPSSMGYAQNLMGMYDTADERRRRSISETQKLFGTIA